MDSEIKKIILDTIRVECRNDNEFSSKFEKLKAIMESLPNNDDKTFIVIARVIMEFWKEDLYCWAESVIHTHAITEGYFNQSQLKHILAFDNRKTTSNENIFTKNDVIISADEIIYLIWDVFRLKEHYNQTKTHRDWIKNSYNRLKRHISEDVPDRDEFIKQMDNLIENHDLSKYAFSQAIGYTLQWIHNIQNTIWSAALKLHVSNEPHHVEYYKKANNKFKIYKRYFATSERDEMNIYNTYESFIDMVACEWERKKGKKLDISDSDLVSMDDKWLKRYTKNEMSIIRKLIDKCLIE